MYMLRHNTHYLLSKKLLLKYIWVLDCLDFNKQFSWLIELAEL